MLNFTVPKEFIFIIPQVCNHTYCWPQIVGEAQCSSALTSVSTVVWIWSLYNWTGPRSSQTCSCEVKCIWSSISVRLWVRQQVRDWQQARRWWRQFSVCQGSVQMAVRAMEGVVALLLMVPALALGCGKSRMYIIVWALMWFGYFMSCKALRY